MKEEFWVLVRDEAVIDINWREHGPKGVYGRDYVPEVGDRVLLVRALPLEEHLVNIAIEPRSKPKKKKDTVSK